MGVDHPGLQQPLLGHGAGAGDAPSAPPLLAGAGAAPYAPATAPPGVGAYPPYDQQRAAGECAWGGGVPGGARHQETGVAAARRGRRCPASVRGAAPPGIPAPAALTTPPPAPLPDPQAPTHPRSRRRRSRRRRCRP
jgi:hypothetical protein